MLSGRVWMVGWPLDGLPVVVRTGEWYYMLVLVMDIVFPLSQMF